jgi:ribose transport system substrate-binding protein
MEETMTNDAKRSGSSFSRRRVMQAGAAVAGGLAGLPFINRIGKAASMEGRTLGFSMSFTTVEWLVAQREGVRGTAERHGFNTIISDANDSPTKQVRDIEDLVVRQCDIILISTYFAEAIAPAVRTANEAGIPIVVLSSSLKGDVDWTSHLSTDTMGTATDAGHFYVDKLGGKGKVVQIEGKPGSVVNQMRGKGWRNVIEAQPGIEIVAHVVANYQRAEALRSMEDILQANPKIDAVYCHNDEMALGAIQAVKEAGRAGEMWFTGYDGLLPEVMKAIYEGDMLATWQYLPFGVEAVEIAVRILEGNEVPKEIVFPSPLVTKDNVTELWDPSTRTMKPAPSRLDMIKL